MRLPPWMLEHTGQQELQQPDKALVSPVKQGLVTVAGQQASIFRPRSKQRNLARRTIGQFAQLLAELSSNEEIAAQPGLLQQIDPRAKVIGVIGLVVCVTLLQHLNSLLFAYALCLLLALLSRVPLRRLTHTWLVIPLFSAAIILPAMLNIVTPGEPVITLWHFSRSNFGHWQLPASLTITDAGLFIFARFILRTAICVTLALLLSVTTPANRLFRGLRSLRVPLLFIMLLNMMERYLTIFLRAATEIHLAKISRSLGKVSVREEQAWVASGMGALFRRTHALGNAVYLAMLSRGYRGEIYLLEEERWQLSDWAFIMIAVGTTVSLLILG